ncbi:CD48 antigen [Pteropus alecto]|uniref:CD48 antigen n=1 Tax=Pteropus alecto TaxID=9402 RepID=UPI0003F16736|nr:CD48 antigen [Pteropus alecto]
MYSKRVKWQQALEILLLLHLFLETSIQGCSEQLIVVSGSNVSLQICNLPDKYKKLTWFYTDTQKIVEWESNTPKPHYFNSKFKDRVTFDHQNGTLHIYKVRKEDSSTYLLKILKEAGTEEERKIFLKVFDPVSKPVINITKIKEVNNSCYLNLSCVAWGQSLNYTWYRDSGPFPKELWSSKLVINVEPQNYSKFYICQVSNPVSNKNRTVYFTSACEQAPASGVAWIATWLVVMVLTALGFLLT